ncbi:hypothetical protein D3C72_2267390 [compost metagenome]
MREATILRRSAMAPNFKLLISLELYSMNSTSSEAQPAATSASAMPVRNTVVTRYPVPTNRLAY